MNGSDILKAPIIDIIFENRNKAYGAYELRTRYNSRLALSLLTTCSLILIAGYLASARPRSTSAPSVISEKHDTVTVHIFNEPPPPIPQPKVLKQMEANLSGRKFVDKIELVADVHAADVPDIDVLATTPIGDEHSDGASSINGPVNERPGPPGNGVEEAAAPVTGDFVAVEKNANFPGGQEAWSRFLTRHLRSPEALEDGQKRIVMVRFVVGIDGRITQFEVVQSGGISFDKEVLRVLKKMPDWEPALQNGHPVSVMFTQPVTFMSVTE